jgi:hypothetical protein
VAPIADAVHAVMNGMPIPVRRTGPIKRSRSIEETEWLERHFILHQVLKNPDISDRAISRAMGRIQKLWTKCDWACSPTTVWRQIQFMQVNCTRSTNRPAMKEDHIHARLEFAHLANNEDPRFQIAWYFSDECSIDLNPYPRHAYHVPHITTVQGVHQNYSKHPPRIMV